MNCVVMEVDGLAPKVTTLYFSPSNKKVRREIGTG